MTDFFIYVGYGISGGMLIWVTTWGVLQAIYLFRHMTD